MTESDFQLRVHSTYHDASQFTCLSCDGSFLCLSVRVSAALLFEHSRYVWNGLEWHDLSGGRHLRSTYVLSHRLGNATRCWEFLKVGIHFFIRYLLLLTAHLPYHHSIVDLSRGPRQDFVDLSGPSATMLAPRGPWLYLAETVRSGLEAGQL